MALGLELEQHFRVVPWQINGGSMVFLKMGVQWGLKTKLIKTKSQHSLQDQTWWSQAHCRPILSLKKHNQSRQKSLTWPASLRDQLQNLFLNHQVCLRVIRCSLSLIKINHAFVCKVRHMLVLFCADVEDTMIPIGVHTKGHCQAVSDSPA